MKKKIKKEKEKSEYSGLCSNCDNRQNCKIRDKNFVVWHCEEYE